MVISVIANVSVGNLEDEDTMTVKLLPSMKYVVNIIYNYFS